MRTGSWLIVRLERPDDPKRRKGGNARRNGGPQETTLQNNAASSEKGPGACSQGKNHVGEDMARMTCQVGWVQEKETNSLQRINNFRKVKSYHVLTQRKRHQFILCLYLPYSILLTLDSLKISQIHFIPQLHFYPNSIAPSISSCVFLDTRRGRMGDPPTKALIQSTHGSCTMHEGNEDANETQQGA